MSALVIPRILGGLGNQLFVYAAARRLALVNNAELAIDNVSGFRYDTQYQRHYQLDHFSIPCRMATSIERLEPFSRIRRNLIRRWNRRIPFEQRRYLVQEGHEFDSRLLSLHPEKRLYLEGNWQSESYFKDVEPQIRQDLQIRPPTDAANLACANHISQQPAVAVHVRFFDDPASTKGDNISNDYYSRAVQAMESKISGAHYFLFSDRPEVARGRIPITDNRITLVRHNQGDENAYADFWLMSQCQHFIIPNSTFSWWAAWLAGYQDKIIIAPKFEEREGVTPWDFDGLIPDQWVKL